MALAIKSDKFFLRSNPGRFSGPGHSGNHGGERMLEAKPLTFLWKYWNCLKWGETSIAMFRHHLPLHTILSTKGFFADRTEPTRVNSSGAECRLRKRKNVEHLYRFSGHKIPMFSSTTTTTTATFLLFSLHHHHHHHRRHHISIQP